MKHEFTALDISMNKFLSWIFDTEIHLEVMNLGETIKEENNVYLQDHTKAMIFICHHFHEGLKVEYLTVKDPFVLWKILKERYGNQKFTILPQTHYDWLHLRLQDFKSINEYNSTIFKTTSQMKLYGENITENQMLEKTFSAFHASNIVLQQQYKECNFKRYLKLFSCLLVIEQNNEF
jgi:hypothetical protein